MIIDILNDLIKFKTVYPNYNEVRNCMEYIKNYFSDTNLHIKEFSYNNDRSIFISNTTRKNLDVLFVGHIDVVSACNEDFNPKKIGNKLYGRGSFDMKGHDAVMMKLLKDNRFNIKVGLLLTSDEERGGFNGTYKFLNDLKYNTKIAIVPDAGNNFNVITEEKGVLQLKVSYVGKEAHSSQVWNGDNAICKIINLYNHLIEKYPIPCSSEDYKTSINISKIEGGNSINMVADNCFMILDIRHQEKDKKEDFIKLIKSYDKKIKIDILAQGDVFLTTKNVLYNHFEESYKKVLKKEVIFSKFESASDGRFFYSKRIPCVMMNAKGDNIHSKGEYVDIKSLDTMYQIFLNFLENCDNK